jgi:phage terminase small subunit
LALANGGVRAHPRRTENWHHSRAGDFAGREALTTVALNDKQARFAAEFIVDLNATHAAERAGYSKKTAYSIGSRLVRHPEVAAEIERLRSARGERVQMTGDEVLRRIASIARADVRRVIKWGEAIPVKDPVTGETLIANGLALVDSEKLSEDDASAIAEVAQTKEGLRIKFHSKPQALDALARHHGLFDRRAFGGFRLPPIATAQDCVSASSAILAAAAEGKITLEQAEKFSGLIEAQRRAFDTALAAETIEDLKAQLDTLTGGDNGARTPRSPAA